MDKLVEMAARVLRTGQAETLVGADAQAVFDNYFERVQEPVDALRREQARALEEQRFVTCR